MVDRSKVAVMTEAARAEKKNHRKMDPAVGYFMYDYVLLQVIKGVIAVTLLYAAVAGCYLLYTMEQWINASTIYDLVHMCLGLGKLYGFVLIIAILFLSLIYSLRYIQARRLAEDQEEIYRELDSYYYSGRD